MKTRNVDLSNTPLLTNNICKYIDLEAPTLPELKKKVKEYEITIIRALTNAYKLSKLSLDKNGAYTVLPDGNYHSSIFLNFSGTKKEETTNPEGTLQYIKRLTEMESKRPRVNLQQPIPKQKIREHHKSIIVPIEIKPGDIEIEVVSNKQRQILEQLITDTNLIKILFLKADEKYDSNTNIRTIFLKIQYNCREILELSSMHSNPEEPENR